MAEMVAGQGDVEGVAILPDAFVGPSRQFGIAPDPLPGSLAGQLSLEPFSDPMAKGLGIEFIAHFNQPIDILLGAKTGIEPELDPDWGRVAGIVRFKLTQMLQ